jgi:DNA-directed RNA polymerase specialized sigma24 family protein
LNETEFESLIRWLGPNPEDSARKYEEIRRKLMRLFAFRGSGDPESLADITIDRVAHSVGQSVFGYKGDPILYFYGFARNVLHESARQQARTIPLNFDIPHPTPDGSDELRHECLEKCLLVLSPKNREFIKAYYEYEPGKKASHRDGLARQMGLKINALRIHAHRLRVRLRNCVGHCMARGEQ